MGISEIIIIMLVYGGLFLFVNLVSSNNKLLVYVKWASFIILYGYISTIIWFTYKAEEEHTNSHSGYAPISLTGEAILMIAGLTIYSVILFWGFRLLNKASYK
ncbi:peptide ABC transporter permease [Ureibacillus composti]|nr:peptide ABC transporter permease [Ureibacillus composti]